MTEPVITVRMSSNEKGSGRDVAVMKEVDRHPGRWDFDFADIDLDLLFQLGDREIRWELKMPADLLQSWQSGHLAAQRMQAASYDHPAMIGVLGGSMDVLEHIPKVTKQSGYLNPRERAGFEGSIERWEAACFASGFPVHYFSGGLDNNMRRICRWSKNYLLGEIKLPRPKAESVKEAMLMCLPGVGDTLAHNMLEGGIEPALWCEHPPNTPPDEYLFEKLITIPKIGKGKATKIMAEMR